MKAITLWQPYASLIACGEKKYETRSWKTDYRGAIAIHAAAREVNTLGLAPPFASAVCGALYSVGMSIHRLPYSCIIATAELVGCHKIVRHGGRGMSSQGTGWLETESGIYIPTEQEELFGDWTPGRYAWELTNIKVLPEPVPAKGKQRLWEFEGNL